MIQTKITALYEAAGPIFAAKQKKNESTTAEGDVVEGEITEEAA